MKPNRSNYLFKMWLSVIAVTPLLFIAYSLIKDKDFAFDSRLFLFYFLFVLYGLLFSIPAMLVVSISSYFITRRLKDAGRIRLYYILTSIVCMAITFRVLFTPTGAGEDALFSELILTLLYGITIIVFGLLYHPE
jgi:uncharacterized membrane protein YhaH (DUF805 family)